MSLKPVLTEFEKALQSLRTALSETKNDFIRDATIQRFEYCLELAWKTTKKAMGTASTAPRVIVREMATQGLIESPEPWFEFLDARNLSSHTYKEDIAEQVYHTAGRFLIEADKLLSALKKL